MAARAISHAVGCAVLLPATVVGVAALADGAGPRGWAGLSEMLGWLVACALAARLVSYLTAAGGRSGVGVGVLACALCATGGYGLYRLMGWLGMAAPLTAKIAFTSSLQVIGTGAAVIGAILLALLAARWWSG